MEIDYLYGFVSAVLMFTGKDMWVSWRMKVHSENILKAVMISTLSLEKIEKTKKES